MDALLSPGDLAFRDEVRAFLAAALPDDLRRATRRATSVFIDPAISLAWQRILHARGWVAPDWPERFGGTGWSELRRYIFAAECARARAPALAPMGLKMVAPVLMHYGSDAQRAHYLPRILSGEDYWCQGFSEPGAGSDLAALGLRAADDGDDYVLNGSKIWTTHAQFANRIFCLVRTGQGGRPQAGISFLLIDMGSPGIRVDPIVTLAGDHELNQVFFDDVRVPKANRLGAENDGWTVAKHLLTFERGGRYAPPLIAYLEQLRTVCDPLSVMVRNRLATAAIELDALQALELHAMSDGLSPADHAMLASMLKIMGTEASQRLDDIALEIGGVDAWAWPSDDTPDTQAVIVPRYLNNRAASIYGGSNEIQRDIIARQLLGAIE
ncbi:acyl-CoA dehydrogenase family protein [Sphingomonas colocasiae]|uniref:Acyl-CoA dehydrogenase family protein n=1 Tax=Sphingomonas colocasiae TaxID=1848973 RepID=A0ABS7PJB4_9SPHN|nr:acyl-CoA dehydrogenase family protein [Sphingomonas colocasiae]MBY8820845.1 acyl-CoA dehydrogenase family protein [Sphingomonas colocasiae]